MAHGLMPPEALWQRVLLHMIGTLSCTQCSSFTWGWIYFWSISCGCLSTGQQGVGGCGTCLVFFCSVGVDQENLLKETPGLTNLVPGIFSRLPTDETGGQSWVNQASRLPRPTKPYKGTCASQVFLVISKTLHFGKILNYYSSTRCRCSSSTRCRCRCSSSTRCRCARLENSRLKLSWGMRALT